MTFPFLPFEVDANPASPAPVVFRPVVRFWAIGPRGRQLLYGLIDTGADDTVLPLALAQTLGIVFEPQSTPSLYHGLGGALPARYGRLSMELGRGGSSYRWPTIVAFVDRAESDFVILGQAGFLRFFHAAFDYQRLRVRLRPNGLFRGE